MKETTIDDLLTEVKKIADFDKDDLQLFTDMLDELFVPKGEDFLREGQVSRYIGYIKQGLMMHYEIIDGIEVPMDFTKKKQWIAYLKSFSTNSASDIYIKALEDTYLLTLSSTNMMELFQKQPKFMAIKNHYVELSFIRNNERTSDLATLNATQRYHKFVKNHPDLVQKVPQYLIASYLGIKPQSLSRLRKK